MNNTEETIYDVDFFLKKFEAIPDELWFVGWFHSPDLERHCALGHCGQGTDESGTDESIALSALLDYEAGNINDGRDPQYQQPTPKERILAALKDVKAKSN